MRLLGVQLETSAANEKRIESEAGALRAEIARQETLLSSVQRIEASLMAKAESELENLQVELKHVQESKPDDDTKHDCSKKCLRFLQQGCVRPTSRDVSFLAGRIPTKATKHPKSDLVTRSQ